VTSAELRGLQDGDLDRREEHLYALLDRARTGDDNATDALRALAADYSRYHRSLYCRAMNQADAFVDQSLEGPLLAALADTRYNCQAWAAMGCAAARITTAIPELLALLDRDDWMAREQATIALGAIGDTSVVPVLTALLDDHSASLRPHAADALATIGDDTALAALWAAFEDRKYSRIGYISSALATFGPEVVPRLIDAAGSDDPDTRYWAAVALGSTGDERVVPVLERMIATDNGETVFDGWCSVAAKKALRTHRRIQKAIIRRGDVGVS